MIHYSIYFSFRSEVQEADGLLIVHTFLSELQAAGSVAGFQLLRNIGVPCDTTMLPFQALIEFSDNTQFQAAFSSQAASGIHVGLHGQIMSSIQEFRIDVFRQIEIPTPEQSLQYGCDL